MRRGTVDRPTNGHAFNRMQMEKKRVRTKSRRAVTVVSVVAAIALAVMGYFVYATNHNNQLLADSVEMYKEHFISVSPEQRSEMIDAAYLYNADLSARPFTPPPIGHDSEHERWGEYSDQLAGVDGLMATLTIPSQDIALPVYHGTSDEVLHKGAGHLFGTHLPVGGPSPEESGIYANVLNTKGVTAAISAHTGLYNMSMFDNVQYMENGDMAYIHVAGETVAYKMVSDKVVPPDALDAIDVVPGKDYLQLITCTPYGINFNRLVVTMERVDVSDTDMDAPVSGIVPGITGNVSGLSLAMMGVSAVTVLAWILAMMWERHVRKRSYRAIDARFYKAMDEEAGAAA